MLLSARIKNFALIDETEIRFGRGFNVITGETGAGKSVIIQALLMALGGKADKSIIRSGSAETEVELEIEPSLIINIFLKKSGIVCSETVIVRRIYSAEGRNRCFVNSVKVTVSFLKELKEIFLEMSSQYHQSLITEEKKQMDIIDRYSAARDIIGKLEKEWGCYSDAKRDLQELISLNEKSKREEDFLRSELAIIKQAGLYEGIDEEIEEKFRIVTGNEKYIKSVNSAYSLLAEGETTVRDMLSTAAVELSRFSEENKTIKSAAESVEKALIETDAACDVLAGLIDSMEYSPEDTEAVLEKRASLSVLKKKYGGTIDSVIRRQGEIEHCLKVIDNFDEKQKVHEQKTSGYEKEVKTLCRKLAGQRRRGGEMLARSVTEKLKNLGMEKAVFSVEYEAIPIGPAGSEKPVFYIRANEGEPRLPVSATASGGEMSRIMLSIKSSLAEKDNTPLIIFDEIDAGLSADMGIAAAEELLRLSVYHQVIAVTHMPQIAGTAMNHIKVKKISSGRTSVKTERLEKEEKLSEIARMLGDGEDEATIGHAARILKKTGRKG